MLIATERGLPSKLIADCWCFVVFNPFLRLCFEHTWIEAAYENYDLLARLNATDWRSKQPRKSEWILERSGKRRAIDQTRGCFDKNFSATTKLSARRNLFSHEVSRSEYFPRRLCIKLHESLRRNTGYVAMFRWNSWQSNQSGGIFALLRIFEVLSNLHPTPT